jgi:hypothetical protein
LIQQSLGENAVTTEWYIYFRTSTTALECPATAHRMAQNRSAPARWYDGIPGDGHGIHSALLALSTVPDLPRRRYTHRRHEFVRELKSIPALRTNQKVLFQAL